MNQDLETKTLPVLPLRNGVVFPHMVVTLRIETAEGKIALAAAAKGDDRLILVPRVRGKYASVGTIAEIQQTDDDGNVVVSGVARARVGSGSTDSTVPCGSKSSHIPRSMSMTRPSTNWWPSIGRS